MTSSRRSSSVLKEQVAHHAHKEEENKLFPKVKDLMTEDERLGLGNEVLAMFEELMQKHPYKTVPSETAMAAQLPPVKSMRRDLLGLLAELEG